MKKNKFLTAALCAALAVSMAAPAYAIGDPNTFYTYGNNTRYTRGEKFTAPGWVWNRGHCYYITAERGTDIFARNTVTPDGYTVDEQGRWTVNGVVQTNNFGHEKFWADKNINCSDEERWQQIKDGLLPIWTDSYISVITYGKQDPLCAYYEHSKNFISNGQDYLNLLHNTRDNEYLYLEIGSNRDMMDFDVAEAAADAATAIKNLEFAIKAVLGDNAGQEFFDYYMSLYSEWTENGFKTIYDENGNVTKGWATVDDNGNWTYRIDPNGPDLVRKQTTITRRTIQLKSFDISRFQNKKTDYGKTYTVQRRSENAISLIVY